MSGATSVRPSGGASELRARFSLRFPATEIAARENVAVAARRLSQAGLAPERAGEIEIALAEAVNNVVEHAYCADEAGTIRLLCSLRPGFLDIRICDSGRPLPSDRLPLGLAANLDVPREDLPEGGFGWFLIRALTTDIRYDRCGASNHLSLRFLV